MKTASNTNKMFISVDASGHMFHAQKNDCTEAALNVQIEDAKGPEKKLTIRQPSIAEVSYQKY